MAAPAGRRLRWASRAGSDAASTTIGPRGFGSNSPLFGAHRRPYRAHPARIFKEPAVAVDVNLPEYSAHDPDRCREAIESHVDTALMTPLGL